MGPKVPQRTGSPLKDSIAPPPKITQLPENIPLQNSPDLPS